MTSNDRLGELEMLSRTRNLTSEESDELAHIITKERRRTHYRNNRDRLLAGLRQRYATDPAYRRKRIDSSVERRRKRDAEHA